MNQVGYEVATENNDISRAKTMMFSKYVGNTSHRIRTNQGMKMRPFTYAK